MRKSVLSFHGFLVTRVAGETLEETNFIQKAKETHPVYFPKITRLTHIVPNFKRDQTTYTVHDILHLWIDYEKYREYLKDHKAYMTFCEFAFSQSIGPGIISFINYLRINLTPNVLEFKSKKEFIDYLDTKDVDDEVMGSFYIVWSMYEEYKLGKKSKPLTLYEFITSQKDEDNLKGEIIRYVRSLSKREFYEIKRKYQFFELLSQFRVGSYAREEFHGIWADYRKYVRSPRKP